MNLRKYPLLSKYKWMVLFALASLADGLFSIYIINTGIGFEINPIMKHIFTKPEWFGIAFKLLMPVIIWLLIRNYDCIRINWVFKVCFIIELLICIYLLIIIYLYVD